MTNSRTRVLVMCCVLAALVDAGLGAQQAGGRAGGPPIQPVGQGQAGGAPQPQQVLTPGHTQLVGKVVEAGSSSGVAGATVTLNGPLGASTAMFTNGIPGGPRRMLTDGQGQFVFRDLPAGAYTITSTAAGYVDGAYGETRIITIRRTLDLNRMLDIADNDRVVSAQIQMWKLGGISGRVLDENGEPLVGAPVTVFARMTDWGGPIMQLAANATTDDRGMYHVDVTPGDFVVAVQNATTTAPISVIEGFQQAMSEGNQALQRYVEQMQVGGGLLARGVGVRVGNFSVMPRTNLLTGFPPVVVVKGRLMMYATTYHPGSLTAPAAGLVTLQSGEERSGVDVHVQLLEARRVSGRLVGPNGPVAGVTVALIAPDPAVMRTSPATLFDVPQSVTDGNGDFTFIGIAPGPYLIRTYRPESSAASPLLWAIESITVPVDSDVAEVQLMMKGGARVTGRIVVEGTGAKPPTSQQLRFITVTVRPVPGSGGAILGTTLRPVTDHPDDTHFSTSLAVPGPHMMTVSYPSLPPGYVLKSVTSAGQNIVDKSFDLPAAGLSDVVVTITDQISTLTGLARDEAGRPVPAATVAVFPADKSLWRLPGMASRRVLTAAPGRDGRYTFRGLPAGDYIVAAADWPVADFSDGTVLTKITPAGARVTLGDGESRTQDLRVVVIR